MLRARTKAPLDELLEVGTANSVRPQTSHSFTERAYRSLNATPDAQAAATHVLDTDDLRDVLALL
jgi:hypothetical protein